MEIVITSDEFRRLSYATQKELLGFLVNGEGDMMFGQDDTDAGVAVETSGSSNPEKKVLPINSIQAAELLSNLAEKSQQTLRLFALGGRVDVKDLVGEGCPYKDMNDLKRSFVAAVNRRLRTVVGDRSAVLFSSDRDRQRIRVLPVAAAALRHAMGIPEPEPSGPAEAFDYEEELGMDDASELELDWQPNNLGRF